uniref:Tc1-like transposase DDE domain-containing protein n=1 Tax=Emiliania huxleyi TaxID=2903 RepID=A0A7S3VZ17_EMIHU|mmetsp:Transcript_21710/g.63468  ORF Transcript_21710/g.63468 Transcript_21710/m.63468 type:complete len:420 (-) Transcript_21710:13-1272(-)
MSAAPKQLSKRVQRRMTCAYMINDLREDPASAAHKVGFDRTSTALKWAKQMEEHGHCLDNGTRESANPRGPKPSWTEENVHKLHSALHADPTGTGAGRIASTLAKEDDTFPKLHGTTWARALKLCDYSCQKSTMKYNIDPEQRLRFCNSSRDLSLSSNGMFTDSKMFAMGGSYKPGKPMMQWAPNGQPRQRDGAKATHRVHAYAGVTAHGATKLYFASGTTGMKDNYKSPTKKVKKAAPANASRKRSRAQADEEGKPLSGVGAEEWRNILQGKAEFARTGPGLLQEAVTIFTRVGKARVWAFQCDGASSQSLSQSGLAVQGPKNRAVIKAVAPKLVEGWPAHSPDLSPIENVFSRVEWLLWTDPEFKWNDFESFKVALRAAWAKVTGGTAGSAYLKKTVGSFEKRRRKCIELQGGRTKY